MDVTARLRELMEERNWTEYRLAKEAGLSQSTISNMFNRGTVPSVATLETICNGLGITLGQFFSEGQLVELTGEQAAFFRDWKTLKADEKELVRQIVEKLKR